MATAALALDGALDRALDGALDGGRAKVRARLQQALDTAQQSRSLPTLPALADVLPGGALRAGATYAVTGSTSLAMAMMAGPSGDGGWCGVVGMPRFGAEAAAGLGVELDRLVLVPDPGREWLNVVAALADALTLVLVRPPGRATAAETSRLSARMRTRGSVLVVTGPHAMSWPGAEARLRVEQSRWAGLDTGAGYLTTRQATLAVTGRGTAGRPRRHLLWLPGPDGTLTTTPALTDSTDLTAHASGPGGPTSTRSAGDVLRPDGRGPLRTAEPVDRRFDATGEPVWHQEAVG